MRIFTTVPFTIGILFAAIVAFIASRQLSTNVSAASQRQSYSLRYLRTSRNAASQVMSQTSHFYGVRKDGATVQQNVVDQPGGGPPRVTTMLFLPTEAKSVVISHALHRLSTKYLTPEQMRRKQTRLVDAYCSGVANASNGRRVTGTDKVLGIDVVKYESRNSEQAETIFVAPLLDCSVLKFTTTWLKDGEVTEVASEEPVSITLEEPNANLFSTPANYAEGPLSEIRDGLWKSIYPDKPVPECMRKSNQRDDSRYARSRKR